MNRVGIFGGTFNPIHFGHLLIAQRAAEAARLDKVCFVPSYSPPHKSVRNVVEAGDRYRMVQRAIRGHDLFEVSDFETRRRQKSFSYETVAYMSEKYKGKARLFFIIGADSYETLSTWKNIEVIARKVTFIAVSRGGYALSGGSISAKILNIQDIWISSTEIRRRLKARRSVKFMTPDSVIQYIEQNKLYGGSSTKR